MFEKLKVKVKELKKQLTALYYAYLDSRTPLLPKMIIMFALAYALSPIDLIPDFIPVLGYLDDLLILPALITLSIKLIPPEIFAEAGQKAQDNPVKLAQNRIMPVFFILIWIVVIYALFNAVSGFVKND
jgi:uncharacterized membrane protein YkvA (DUF1232 family)